MARIKKEQEDKKKQVMEQAKLLQKKQEEQAVIAAKQAPKVNPVAQQAVKKAFEEAKAKQEQEDAKQ